MKRSILVALACLLLGSAGFGQQNAEDAPASKEDVQRYMDTMHVRSMMKDLMGAMTQQMHKTVHELVSKQQGLPSDFEAQVQKRTDDMLKDFPVDDYLAAVTPVYQKHLTKGDVDALVAFYSTPTGEKILKELPAMTAEAMQAASPIIQKMMAKTMQEVQTEIAQAQKQNDAKPAEKPQQN